jgi:tetratricopeptide (TPR) repeat protein
VLTSLIRFVFISFLFSSAAVFSADNVFNSTEPSALQVVPQNTSNAQLPEWFYRELTSIRKDVSVLDSTGASKEQIQELKERIGKVEVRLEESQLRVDGKLNEQSGRIGDIYASTDRFGIIASALGLIASVIAVMFGWISAGKKAKSEAKKHVDDWLNSNKAELDAQFFATKEKLDSTLKVEIASAKDQIEELIRSSKGKIETIETRMDSLENTIVDRVTSSLGEYDLKNITEEERQDIEENAEEALTKSEGERTAADWKLLAVKAYFNKSFDDTLSFINKALTKQESFSNFENADFLFLKGVTLGQLNRPEEAIVLYDELLEKFKDSDELIIQKLVVKALRNKGVRLNRLGRTKDALELFDEVIRRFKKFNELTIQVEVAAAFLNKAARLDDMGKLEGALIVYDEVVDLYKDNPEVDIQRFVVGALVSKGLALSKLSRSDAAIVIWDKVLNQFKDSEEPEIQKQVVIALISKATVLAKQDKKEAAIELCEEVFNKYKDSVEKEIQELVEIALANKRIFLRDLYGV